jgi:hypothetical protein
MGAQLAMFVHKAKNSFLCFTVLIGSLGKSLSFSNFFKTISGGGVGVGKLGCISAKRQNNFIVSIYSWIL